MAKKVRSDGERKEEKKVAFEPPEFDEREYLEEQLQNIKVNVIFILYGIPFGALGAYIGVNTGSGLVGLVSAIMGYIVGILVLRVLTDIDLLSGPRRQLASSAAMFIFTFLAFAVLLSNPPVHDTGDPSITDVMVYVQKEDYEDGLWEVLMVHKGRLPANDTNRDRVKDTTQKYFLWTEDFIAREGDNLTVLVRTADPAGLRGVWFEYWYDTPNGTLDEMVRVTEEEWETYEDRLGYELPYELWGEHYYRAVIHNASAGSLYFTIISEDVNGHKTTYVTDFKDTIFVGPAR